MTTTTPEALPDGVVMPLADWLHGAGCTCPYTATPEDVARARSVLARGLAPDGLALALAEVRQEAIDHFSHNEDCRAGEDLYDPECDCGMRALLERVDAALRDHPPTVAPDSHPDDGHDHHFTCIRCGVNPPTVAPDTLDAGAEFAARQASADADYWRKAVQNMSARWSVDVLAAAITEARASSGWGIHGSHGDAERILDALRQQASGS